MKLFNENACKTLLRIGRPIAHQTGISKTRYKNLSEKAKTAYKEDSDCLGYGYFYYGMVRTYLPEIIVAIGSGYGFVPMILAHGARDNGQGHVHFIDPSLGPDNCWKNEERTSRRFKLVDVTPKYFTHYKMKNRKFYEDYLDKEFSGWEIDLLFIDGSDKKDDIEFDFWEIGAFVKKDGWILIHDTEQEKETSYAEPALIKKIKTKFSDNFDVIRFPGKAGFSLIRVLT